MPVSRAILYAATLGVVVLTIRTVFLAPPPVGWALFALALYNGFVLLGIFNLRLRIFADAIVRGPKGARGIALTFDDGPDPVWTTRVLDTLDRAGVKATFFVIGRKAEAHPDLVRDILRRGHAVGLHSYAHDRLFSLRSEARVSADLERGIAALSTICGARPTLFRPPIGHTNPIIARVAERLDLTIVGWTVSGRDGTRFAKPANVAARIRARMRDGAIVLLHDAAERGKHDPAGVAALGEILRAIDAERLPIVPLAAWVDAQAAGSST